MSYLRSSGRQRPSLSLLPLLAALLLIAAPVATQAGRSQQDPQQRAQLSSEPQRTASPSTQPFDVAQAAPRSATEPPVPVRVVPTPKTEAELAAEQRDRDEARERFLSIEWKLTIFAGLLIVLGLLLVGAFMMQAFFVWLGLRAMRRSAQLADRNLMIAQRAFVFLESKSWNIADGAVAIVPVWANSGTTPTRSLRITANWRGWQGEMPGDFVHSYARPPDRMVLGPKGSATLGTMPIPMSDIEAAVEQRVQLYVWGRATYEDIFDGSAQHFFEFCYRIDAAGSAPDAIELTFTQAGLYNRSDLDNVRADAIS